VTSLRGASPKTQFVVERVFDARHAHARVDYTITRTHMGAYNARYDVRTDALRALAHAHARAYRGLSPATRAGRNGGSGMNVMGSQAAWRACVRVYLRAQREGTCSYWLGILARNGDR